MSQLTSFLNNPRAELRNSGGIPNPNAGPQVPQQNLGKITLIFGRTLRI